MAFIEPEVRYKRLAVAVSKSLDRPLTTREKAFLDWVARSSDTEGSVVLCKMFTDMAKAQRA